MVHYGLSKIKLAFWCAV